VFPSFLDPIGPDPTAPPPLTRPAAPSPTGSPEWALAELAAGNQRFVAGAPRHGHRIAAALAAAAQPRPYAAIVGCMDPRVPVEAVFDQDFGAVAVIRTAGHVLDPAAVGSVELAASTLKVRLVVVLGHTRCAAVAVALDGSRPPGNAGHVAAEIARSVPDGDRGRSDLARVVTRRHVAATAALLRTTLGADRPHAAVRVAAGVYDVDTGRVELLSTL
jgi:carbonic anhydrase